MPENSMNETDNNMQKDQVENISEESSEEIGEKTDGMEKNSENKSEGLIAGFKESKVGKTLAHIFEKKGETPEEIAEQEPVVELMDIKGKEMVEMTLKDPEESTKYEAWGAADHLKEAATKATSKMIRDIQHIAKGKNYYNKQTLEKMDRNEIDKLAKSWVESMGDKFGDIDVNINAEAFQHDGFYKIDPVDLRNNDPRLFEQLQNRAEEVQRQKKLGYGDFYKTTSEIEVLNSRVKNAETKVQSIQQQLETTEIQNEILSRILEKENPNAKNIELGNLPETQGIDALTPTLKTFLEKHNITAELDDKNDIKLVRNAEKTQEVNADTGTLEIYKQQMATAFSAGNGNIHESDLHQIAAQLNIARRQQGLPVASFEQILSLTDEFLPEKNKNLTSTPKDEIAIKPPEPKPDPQAEPEIKIETPPVEAVESSELEKPKELTMEKALEEAEISDKEKGELIYNLERKKGWGENRGKAKEFLAAQSRNRNLKGKPQISDEAQEIFLSEVYGEKTPEDEKSPEIDLEELMKEPV